MDYVNAIDAYLLQYMRENEDGEITKATQLVDQLDSSIDWLGLKVSQEGDYQEKAQLQKERTAAEWERDRLIKEISKANK